MGRVSSCGATGKEEWTRESRWEMGYPYRGRGSQWLNEQAYG